jgi:polyisoprenoid-binding protein YceI
MAPSEQAGTTLRARLVDGSLAGLWRLDSAQSTVELRTKSMWGLAPVKGTFSEVTGEGVISATGEASGSLTISSASIDTGNKKRDDHLRSADFFDSANHPDIVFTAQRFALAPEGATAHGTLRVNDTEQPLTFTATVSTSGDEARLDATVPVDRADFGLTWSPMRMASMKNTITVHAVFVRQ